MPKCPPKFLSIFVAALALAPSLAQAQSAAPPAGSNRTIPEKNQALPETDPKSTASTPGSLSDKLDKSSGVITPPGNVDPRMTKQAPVPNPNSTVIVPPPSEKGGATAK